MANFSGGRLSGPYDGRLRNNQSAISGPTVGSFSGILSKGLIRKDIYFGGADYVAGQVKIGGSGSLAYVRVHDSKSSVMVAGGWTDTAGNFSFPNLRSDLTYYAIAFDPISGEQAGIYDRV